MQEKFCTEHMHSQLYVKQNAKIYYSFQRKYFNSYPVVGSPFNFSLRFTLCDKLLLLLVFVVDLPKTLKPER